MVISLKWILLDQLQTLGYHQLREKIRGVQILGFREIREAMIFHVNKILNCISGTIRSGHNWDETNYTRTLSQQRESFNLGIVPQKKVSFNKIQC